MGYRANRLLRNLRANRLHPMAFACALLHFACAHAQTPPAAAARPTPNQFAQRASDAVYKVVPFDREAFYLKGSGPESTFAFYGKSPNEFLKLTCRQAAQFRAVRFANDVAGFTLGECPEEKARLEEAVRNARPGLRQALDSLAKVGSRPSEEQLRRAGIYYEEGQLPDGSRQYYFSLFAVGHGVMVSPTIVVLSKNSAWIVQADLTRLCSQYESDRLCTHTMQTLSQIAAQLASSSPASPSSPVR